jgi:hypothetical protein
MNFLKNITVFSLLFIINFSNAKNIGGAPAYTATPPSSQPAPTMRQPIQQPPAQERSYKDLVAYIKNSSNAWDRNGMLNKEFVATILQKARALGIEDFQLEALLQTARDMHGIFSGDQNKDIAILQAVDRQIDAAVDQL